MYVQANGYVKATDAKSLGDCEFLCMEDELNCVRIAYNFNEEKCYLNYNETGELKLVNVITVEYRDRKPDPVTSLDMFRIQ